MTSISENRRSLIHRSRRHALQFVPSRRRTVRLLRALALAAALPFAALSFAAPLNAAAATSSKPAELVEQLNGVLLEVMRNADSLGYEGRYARLAPVLTETFNFPVMAGISAGRHWRGLSAEQKAELAKAFSRLSIGTFANRFDGYGGERFEVAGAEPGPRGSVLVRNKLIKTGGEVIEINYLMKEYKGQWRAIDVYLDSKYSELAIKRSEHTSVIANEGFDSLIERIEAKLAEWRG